MTHLKWSRFNFLVETSKHQKYLYNSYSNSLIRLEDTLYKNLQSLSRNDGMSNITAFSKEEIEYLRWLRMMTSWWTSSTIKVCRVYIQKKPWF